MVAERQLLTTIIKMINASKRYAAKECLMDNKCATGLAIYGVDRVICRLSDMGAYRELLEQVIQENDEMSNRSLAKQIGVSEGTIRYILKADSKPNKKTLEKLKLFFKKYYRFI